MERYHGISEVAARQKVERMQVAGMETVVTPKRIALDEKMSRGFALRV
jgi:hypothetical protein